MADGVLSDTYWPNVDATNVHTLQYLVTDGSTFTDLQTRDMTYRVVPDPTGMSCTIVASSAAHHYSVTTTYIADPARDAVLMRTRFRGPSGDQVYVTLDPLAGGTGGGGSQNAGGNSASLVGSVPVDANTNTDHQRVQPRLRGPDVRGAPVKPRLRRRERRLRGHRQRRRADARHRASADAL